MRTIGASRVRLSPIATIACAIACLGLAACQSGSGSEAASYSLDDYVGTWYMSPGSGYAATLVVESTGDFSLIVEESSGEISGHYGNVTVASDTGAATLERDSRGQTCSYSYTSDDAVLEWDEYEYEKTAGTGVDDSVVGTWIREYVEGNETITDEIVFSSDGTFSRTDGGESDGGGTWDSAASTVYYIFSESALTPFSATIDLSVDPPTVTITTWSMTFTKQ